jgi:hypothetical protein
MSTIAQARVTGNVNRLPAAGLMKEGVAPKG